MPNLITSDLYHLDEFAQAPEHPGIYVWYSRLSLGPADWDEGHVPDGSAQTQMLRALREHISKHHQQPLHVDATANFSSKWSGHLSAFFQSDYEAAIEDSWQADSMEPLPLATASNVARGTLLQLLENAFPKFSSPLYIGITLDQDLRTRLGQHRARVRRRWEQATKDPEFPKRLVAPKTFADRAIKVGFTPRDLYFYTLHIEQVEGLAPEQLEEILKAAEWLLNRSANPILGRQ